MSLDFNYYPTQQVRGDERNGGFAGLNPQAAQQEQGPLRLGISPADQRYADKRVADMANQIYAAEQQSKVGGLGGRIGNKPMDRGLCQEAAEILGLIHSLESSVSSLRTQLFGSFPESGECGKLQSPSLSEMLVQSRIALGRLIEEVSLLRSKAE